MNKTAVSMLIAIAVVTPQAKQHTESEAKQHTESETEINQHVLAALLDAAKEQCELASAAVDDLARVLAQAKREKDLNRLRAALVTADESLREARQHLGSCQDEMKLISRSSVKTSLGNRGAHPTAAPRRSPVVESEPNEAEDSRHK